jgi:predicted nucleic acid-binding protein
VRFLLDTNVASELRKTNCNAKVREFADKQSQENFFISAVTIGEIAFGMERLPPGKKRMEFLYFIDTQVPEWFGNRILPLDYEIMREWGRMRAKTGRTLPVLDSLIAATTINRRLTLLTRNTRDFEGIEDLLTLNPWEEG